MHLSCKWQGSSLTRRRSRQLLEQKRLRARSWLPGLLLFAISISAEPDAMAYWGYWSMGYQIVSYLYVMIYLHLRGEISPPPVYTFFTEISFSRELRYCARYMAKIKFRQQRGAGDRGIWLGYSSERKPQFYLLNYCPFERTPSFCALLLLILIPLTWSTSLRHVCLATSAPLHA